MMAFSKSRSKTSDALFFCLIGTIAVLILLATALIASTTAQHVRRSTRHESFLHHRDMDENMPGMRGTEALRNVAHMAHGTVMSLAIVVFFPLGGVMIRLFNFRGVIWIHAAWQMFSMLVLITGFALGVWLSVLHNEIWNKTHETFGTVIFLLFLAQPLIGLLQHHYYQVSHLKNPTARPSPWLRRIHTWLGRTLIILGIINGGIGLQLGANTVAGEKAYGAVAGLVFVIYVAVVVLWYWRKGKSRIGVDNESHELRKRDGKPKQEEGLD